MTNSLSVPSLDVEACVNPERLRNLADRILNMADGRADRDPASLRREAEFVRALASALPGIGKDSEAIDALERGLIELECMGTETRYFNVYVPNAPLLTTAGGAPLRAVLAEALSVARAAQPQETSADATQDCYACGHAREQHLNESNELDDCLDCHCSEFMQSPASSPSPERPE